VIFGVDAGDGPRDPRLRPKDLSAVNREKEPNALDWPGIPQSPVILMIVLLTGCTATLQNTPQQDRTWAAYNACRAEGRVNNVRIERVEPDGRWLATATTRTDYGISELDVCMREHLSMTR
jgi:hypothetical protein